MTAMKMGLILYRWHLYLIAGIILMTFHIITIFPHIFDSYLKESILRRAQEKGLIKIKIYNLRDFTKDKHKTVDDRSFGGGPGMVLKVEPMYRAIQSIKSKVKIPAFAAPSPKLWSVGDKAMALGRRSRLWPTKSASKQKSKVILLSAKGKKFDQEIAHEFSKLNDLILICGRYEGVDERVAQYIANEEVSIGNYILSGGELPALVIIETVSRLIPGVLGNIESIEERRSSFVESEDCIPPHHPPAKAGPSSGVKSQISSYPVYTRPAIFSPEPGVEWKVPKVLLSGNHKKIEEWRKKHMKER